MDYLDTDVSVHPLIGTTWSAYVRGATSEILVAAAFPKNVSHAASAWAILKDARIELSPLTELRPEFAGLLAGVVVHEARHLTGATHDCPDGLHDATGRGAWGFQAAYLETHGWTEAAAAIRGSMLGCP